MITRSLNENQGINALNENDGVIKISLAHKQIAYHQFLI